MKKFFACAVFGIWLYYPLFCVAQEMPEVQVQNIFITELGFFEPSETEWVEIFNSTSTPIDLTGWKFFEENTNHGLSAFRGDMILEPQEYAIIASKSDLFAQKFLEYTGTILDSSWGNLKEDGEEIGLKDAASNFVEKFIYPQSAESSVQNPVSFERKDINIPTTEVANWEASAQGSMGRVREAVQPSATTERPCETPPATPQEIPVEQPVEQPVTIPQGVSVNSATNYNSPPTAVIQLQSGALVAQESTTINFDGRASFDPDGDSLSFIWNFGDGITANSANPGLHKFGEPNTYIVTLTVIDEHGAQGQAQQTVQVLNKTPQAKISQPTASVGTVSKNTVIPSLPYPLPSNLELCGYLVLANSNTQTTPKKTTVKKTTAKTTTKKTAKHAFKNGDLSRSVRITEILPDPGVAGASAEWVEIFNGAKSPINLGNWTLSDGGNSKYIIPDSVVIQSGEFTVFQKSETHLSLNNAGDSVTLADFEGTIIDAVSYENAKKGNSYMLINIKKPILTAAGTAIALAASNANDETWEWVADPTPGSANPVFEEISGTVSRLIAGGGASDESSFQITLPDGSSKDIKVSSNILHPAVAQTVLTPGSKISLRAQNLGEDGYEVNKIEDVSPPPPQEKAPDDNSMWFVIAFFVVGLILNILPAVRTIRQWWNSRKTS
ncbi:MAG: lamin tail domain-containing protein [Patescibacteria group bacterium]